MYTLGNLIKDLERCAPGECTSTVVCGVRGVSTTLASSTGQEINP